MATKAVPGMNILTIRATMVLTFTVPRILLRKRRVKACLTSESRAFPRLHPAVVARMHRVPIYARYLYIIFGVLYEHRAGRSSRRFGGQCVTLGPGAPTLCA